LRLIQLGNDHLEFFSDVSSLFFRFPPDAHKPNKESEEARKERVKQEQEIAKTLAEEDDDEDDLI